MSANQGTMRIGEVHALLRKDVPDIELSKIRYYEDKGLVQPSRSRKGYRLYSERDVACLREAIRLANDEFVPLRVVRLRLIEQGLLKDVPAQPAQRHAARGAAPSAVSMPVPSPVPELVATSDAAPVMPIVPDEPAKPEAQDSVAAEVRTSEQYFTTSEFLESCDLEASAVNQLVSLGLLAPVTVANETAFTGLDVRIAQRAAPLIERGVDVRLLGSLRRVVEREIGILEDLTQPLRGQGSGLSADQAHEAVEAVALELSALRAELFTRALREYLGR
jgi:DNA-binding transcriptional MerR regulator